jgi:hypothetical protein
MRGASTGGQLLLLLLGSAPPQVMGDESPSPPRHSYTRPELTRSCSTAIGYRHAYCVEAAMAKGQCMPSGEAKPCPACDHLKNPKSMWHDPNNEAVMSSWGILMGALPEGFSQLAPSGTGNGEYYTCESYSGQDPPRGQTKGMSFSFWTVSSLSSGGGGGGGSRRRRGRRLREREEPFAVEQQQPDEEDGAERWSGFVTDVLATVASWTGSPDPSRRRRMQYPGYGGGGSVGLCVPEICNANDVKIIAGYCAAVLLYYLPFCSSTLALAPEFGGCAAEL